MFKRFVTLAFVTILCDGFAQSIPQQKIDSKLERVTVFLNGAQVTRTLTATLPKGKSEIVLSNLTPSLEQQSVLVKGTGDFTILSVKPQLNFLEEIKRKDTIVALEKERDRLKDLLQTDEQELQILKSEEEILQKNRVQVIGLPEVPTKTEDLTTLLTIQRQKLKEILDKKRMIQKSTETLNRSITKVNAQLSELNARKSTTTGEIVITVFVKSTPSVTNAKLEVSYLVPNVSWYPVYDLRVAGINQAMQAQMKAKIRQNTGEDWREVLLSLSTGEPKRTGVKPELGTWYLSGGGYSYFEGRVIDQVGDLAAERLKNQKNVIKGRVMDEETGEPLIGASVVIKGTSKGVLSDINGDFELPIGPNEKVPSLMISYTGFHTIDIPVGDKDFVTAKLKGNGLLNEVVVAGYGIQKDDNKGSDKNKNSPSDLLVGRMAGVSISDKKSTKQASKPTFNNANEKEQATTLSFDIDIPYSIPTDGKEYQVDIKETALNVAYQYASAPKLDNDAFLTAYLTDWEQYNLPEGEANLYLEGTFMGKTVLKTNSTDDTLKISMGRDKNVSITRTKLKEFGKKGMFSSKRQESRGFEIVVKNKKSVPLSIVIEEQIPVSTDKQIEVDYEAQGAIFDKNKGQLRWTLDLKAGEDRKVKFNYTVKYPSDWRVVLE